MIHLNLPRRNLAPQQASYLRGKRYNVEKAQVPNLAGVNQHTAVKYHFDPQPTTADRLAATHGVSPATIKRDARFAESVDMFEPEVKREILSGKSDYTKQEVIEARGEKEILEAAKRIRQERATERREERTQKINQIAQNNKPLEVELDRLNLPLTDCYAAALDDLPDAERQCITFVFQTCQTGPRVMARWQYIHAT